MSHPTPAGGDRAAAPPRTSARPAYLQASSIALVLLGGGVGAGVREGLSLLVPEADGVQVVVPVVNVLGAFLLGYLYEALVASGAGPSTTARLRLLVGAGFCGGLTTYSSLTTATALLLEDSRWGFGVAYALGTVVVGAAATMTGIVVGSRQRPRRTPARGADR
ncbi:fluoride efflux transporter FluC [Nocardioides dongkuii]|uniref:fluoride efflux transporter FluC n=1 Tax=Nocardioides dongkuii TaxID=2760089 RepID=UPI001878608B|nr:CrcB family protein [Nocardioides dongkuii]